MPYHKGSKRVLEKGSRRVLEGFYKGTIRIL